MFRFSFISTHLFLILLSRALNLLRPPKLLASILPLLPLLSARLLDLGRVAHSHQSVPWLELLHGLDAIVDEGEARGLAAAVLGSHAEDVDLISSGFVDFSEFGAEIVLGDVGAIGVEDVATEYVSICFQPWPWWTAEWWSFVCLVAAMMFLEVSTYTTICFRDRSRFVMNFRVRMVTGWSALAGVAMIASVLQTDSGQAAEVVEGCSSSQCPLDCSWSFDYSCAHNESWRAS